MAQENKMSLGMYLHCRKNLSHNETIEFGDMLEEFKNDPDKPFRDMLIFSTVMVGLLILSMIVLPAIFIIAVRLLS